MLFAHGKEGKRREHPGARCSVLHQFHRPHLIFAWRPTLEQAPTTRPVSYEFAHIRGKFGKPRPDEDEADCGNVHPMAEERRGARRGGKAKP
jgi:hypothetical protein